jgi:hypothetical protein
LCDLIRGGEAGDGDVRVLDDDAVLYVDPLYGGQCSGRGVIRSDELSDDSERLVGVDDLSRAVEGLIAHSEGIEVATGWIAEVIAACADKFARDITGVGCKLGRDGVSFPEIHFVAARAKGTVDINLTDIA